MVLFDMDIENNTTENTNYCGGNGLCRLEQITPLAHQINCLDINRIAEICVKQIPELIRAGRASLYILDEVSDMLHLQKHNHPFLINHIVSLSQNPPSPMVMAVHSKDMLLIDDIETHAKPFIRKSQRRFATNYKSNSCIIAPLLCQGRVEGVLNLADKIDSNHFNGEDVAIIELFRQLLGASIGNIKLFEKIQRQAQTDGLTGLFNHRTFYEILEKELRRSQRYGGLISLIMIDVDNLKKINDNLGHRAGDLAIKTISRRITECIRTVDTAARYGGDEFAVILPNTMLADAAVVAERMVQTVANTHIDWENEKITLSISAGVGQYDGSFCPDNAAKHSDEALYAAKQSGKGRVYVFETVKK
jgi:diguanylate cyclase (GGDEF)-like protein